MQGWKLVEDKCNVSLVLGRVATFMFIMQCKLQVQFVEAMTLKFQSFTVKFNVNFGEKKELQDFNFHAHWSLIFETMAFQFKFCSNKCQWTNVIKQESLIVTFS